MTEKQVSATGAAPLGNPVEEVSARVAEDSVIPSPYVTLQRLTLADAADIYAAQQGSDQLWDYMGSGPFADLDGFETWIASIQDSIDPVSYTIKTDRAVGMASFLRIDRPMRVIEIGHILLTPALQQKREGSAALMAMIAWAFDAGYRRVEWKCNSLNAPSRRAALRLGFTYEGTFRQHMIIKGRNRDTAWYAITDVDWQKLAPAYDAWLDATNFDAGGRQIQNLSRLTEAAIPGRRDG